MDPTQLIDFLLHVNLYLKDFFALHGAWIYALLFLVVFCETGLVVTPFLPGDSLIFAAGALSASTGGALRLDILFLVFITAPLFGDQSNYWIGRIAGKKIPFSPKARFLKQSYLDQTQAFYDRFGGWTVIAARFVPIVRTFAPFVAGLGKMPFGRYVGFSAIGTLLWVSVCLGAGTLFGNIDFVQKNFSTVILGIVGISVLPLVITAIRKRFKGKRP
ncbi:MAG: DedA family protein [Fibrobacterota bacterium]|nr:DedA family protein [Fibrobacterota bacterium]QQS06740.1 MAG: DedA family protein [Fibrobacterota bacterium]